MRFICYKYPQKRPKPIKKPRTTIILYLTLVI
ncbi:MAG: hypothetical protein RLZZ158_138 [Cyanobacteriota bacterium]|jgi:hypothetical protein